MTSRNRCKRNMASANPVIELKDVVFGYAERPILRGLSLHGRVW
jgi:ABC-type molybdenum transport system ATPase subunit/photorepair protein PhrA